MGDYYKLFGRSNNRSWPEADALTNDLPTTRPADWQLAVSPSYKNPSDSITLESTTVAASEVLLADAATATTWSPTTGSGSFSATAAQVRLAGPFVDEVASMDSDRFIEAGSTFGDIASEDFVMEFIGRAPFDGTNTAMIGKITGGVGWQLSFSAGVPTFSIDDNVTEATDADADSSIAAGEWFHIMVICDRSSATGLRIYANGNQSATPDNPSSVGSITNAGNMFIGSTSRDFSIGAIRIWKQASWLNGSDYASVVTQRFQQVQGWYNAQSTATITPGSTHATGDAYDATAGVRTLFQVGANWIPCRIDGDGAYSWSQDATNNQMAVDPEDITDAGWADDVDSFQTQDIADSPFGLGSGNAGGVIVDSDSTDSVRIFESVGGVASTVGSTFTMWAKAGASDYIWVACDASSATYTTEHAIINLTNGSVTKTQPNEERTWRTEDWGNGWYRLIGYGQSSTSSPIAIFGPCDSATDYSVVSGDGDGAGAGTVNLYVHGISVIVRTTADAATDPAYIRTASTSRTADSLTINIASADPLGDGIGSVWMNYKRRDTVLEASDDPLRIYDGSDTTDDLNFTQNANGTASWEVADGTGTDGTVTSTTTMLDATDRELKLAHQTSTDASLKVDGTEESTDTYTASPADLDQLKIKVGIRNLRLYRNKQN